MEWKEGGFMFMCSQVKRRLGENGRFLHEFCIFFYGACVCVCYRAVLFPVNPDNNRSGRVVSGFQQNSKGNRSV